jgi:hypothetical protein
MIGSRQGSAGAADVESVRSREDQGYLDCAGGCWDWILCGEGESFEPHVQAQLMRLDYQGCRRLLRRED